MTIRTFLDYFGWTLLIATILLLTFSQRLLDNIINAKSFLIEYSIIGTFLSANALLLIYKTNPDYFKGGDKRASAILSYFFGIIAIFVFGTAYYNFNTAKNNTGIVKALVVIKHENIRHSTKYLTLKLNGRTERFQPTPKEWEKIEQNDTILLTYGQGNLDFNYIFEFSPDN